MRSTPIRRSSAAIHLLRLILLISIIILSATLLAPGRANGTTGPRDAMIYLAIALVSIFLCFDASRRMAPGWKVVGYCLVVWLIGSAMRLSGQWMNHTTDVSTADFFLTARAALAVCGTMALVGFWTAGVHKTVLLNGLTVATAASSVAVLVGSLLEGDNTFSNLDTFLLLGYPVMDIFIVSMVFGTAIALGAQVNRALACAAVGIIMFTATDVLHVVQFTGNAHDTTTFQDTGWVVSMAFVALASHAGQPTGRVKSSANKGGMVILPTLAAVAALVILVVIGYRTWWAENISESVIAGAMPLAAASVLFGMSRVGVAFHEVTRLHKETFAAKEEIERQALTDALTGLLNRRGFEDATNEAIGSGDEIAFLGFDLNQFKAVNDNFGHHIGDELLCGAAKRITDSAPEGSIVGRMGGDEFVVVLRGKYAAEAEVTARAMHVVITGAPVVLTPVLKVDVSIGVSLLERGMDYETLLQRGDAAMYEAKVNSLAVVMWCPLLRSATVQQLALMSELENAIYSGQLHLLYQPKVSTDGTTMTGVEALVRWNHPEKGLIPPDDFIPYAESTALIHSLTEFVMETAIRQGALWNAQGRPTCIAVNFSGKSFTNDTIIGQVAELLMKHQLPAHLLEVEITETAIMRDPNQVRGVLNGLRDLGVQISLDDFGAGYTSLSQLKTMPIDVLKVDKSIVHGAVTDEPSGVILASIISLGLSLGLKVVAEGVEDAATQDFLISQHCTCIQGWLFSGALPADKILAFADSLPVTSPMNDSVV